MRGARSRGSARAEWPWLVGFALAGTLGGQFANACSEALSATCRSEEWHLRLPAHHYVHVVAGVIEFAFLHDHVSGAALAILSAMLVVFAVSVPTTIAFTVARYAD